MCWQTGFGDIVCDIIQQRFCSLSGTYELNIHVTLHQKDYEEDKSDWSQQSTANDSDTRREAESNQCGAPSPGEFVRGRACDQGSRLNSIWCETATSGHIDPAVVLCAVTDLCICTHGQSVARIYLFAAAIAGSQEKERTLTDLQCRPRRPHRSQRTPAA